MNNDELMSVVAETNIEKPGHIKRFIAAIEILKSSSASSPGQTSSLSSAQSSSTSKDSANQESCTQSQGDVATINENAHGDDPKNLPKPIQDIYIPNPHDEQLKCYNALLFSLHKSSYELISPVQFESYVMSQRHQRWSVEKEFKAVEAFFESATSKESLEGNAINIRKYTGVDASKFFAKDTKRAENTIDYVNRLNTRLSKLKKLVLNFKSSLYDSEYVVKPWKANELMYYDEKLVKISNMMQHVSDLDRKLNDTFQSLKRKFSKGDIDMAEKNRKRRRQAENAKADENIKTSRLLARCAEVIKMVAPADFAHLDCIKMQKEKCINLVITDADFASAMPELKPRYHLNALTYLISNGVLLGTAKEDALVAKNQLQESQIVTKRGNITKKNSLKEQKKEHEGQKKLMWNFLKKADK